MEGTTSASTVAASPSFYSRHQFLIYRLFSLCGLVPVGAYMVVHLTTNATILNGVPQFQAAVDKIHSLGIVLPLVEWTFIFIPLMFHAAVGWLIISGAVPNTSSYPYVGNVRYVMQRVTAIIAFFYILFHVMQLNHLGSFLGPTIGGLFEPESASSSTAEVLRPLWAKVVYTIGVLACVFHFSNGLWTLGITWGIWTTKAAQRRANYVSVAVGLALATIGMSALVGFSRLDPAQARQVEQRLDTARQYIEGAEVGPLESGASASPSTPSSRMQNAGVASPVPVSQ